MPTVSFSSTLPISMNRNDKLKRSQHVVPTTDGWAVTTSGAYKPVFVVSTQAKAIEKATRIARDNSTGVFVHGRDGRIREFNSFGRDPIKLK